MLQVQTIAASYSCKVSVFDKCHIYGQVLRIILFQGTPIVSSVRQSEKGGISPVAFGVTLAFLLVVIVTCLVVIVIQHKRIPKESSLTSWFLVKIGTILALCKNLYRYSRDRLRKFIFLLYSCAYFNINYRNFF